MGSDLHYPKPVPGLKEEPFLTYCDVEEIEPYAVPYRCLYSRNIDNLFMAGRNISVTHVALGTVRVMRTGGMMGEVVGMAASLCKTYQTTPRGVYEEYLSELKALMQKGVGKKGFPEADRIRYVEKGGSLIPWPDSVFVREDVSRFVINRLQTVHFPEKWNAIEKQFIQDLQKRTSLIVQTTKENAILSVKENGTLSPESYCLEIGHSSITIEAGDIRGLNYALTTFQQLILGSKDGTLPQLVIKDRPRFGYRGVMLDCSRHFWTVDELKQTIDQMSFFKLNTLHLHLTDNQGWRLAMDKYPQLAERGSYYYDFPELSGHYYGKNELKDLVAHAAMRGIEIIPEVDLPGHSMALLAGLPELSCHGGTFETYPEERDGDKRKRAGENMVCVGNPRVFEFVEDVVEELIEIFPSRYIHLGGDEVSTGVWSQCPKCMALYRKEGMKDLHEIQDYFTKRVSQIVRSKGKVMVGWEEINARNAASPEDMLTVWQNDGVEQQRKALTRNIPVIMCPKDPCYYDFGYARNPLRKVYEWEPVDDWIAPEKRHLIKGGQACLWTEFVTTQEEVERMFYPRLCALSEVLWCRPNKKDWDNFAVRMQNVYPQLKAVGIHFYEGDTLGGEWFKAKNSYPELVMPARIETNIRAIQYYDPEYAFDGKYETFFASSFATGKENYFLLELDKPQKASHIHVICDESKEYLDAADLLISRDGLTFVKVADFDSEGADAHFEEVEVKAVKIQMTGKNFRRLVIREIEIE